MADTILGQKRSEHKLTEQSLPDRGYGGHDEDQGQMGGISALMAIGLFSLTGNVDQNPSYEITSPIFDRIEITLDDRYYEKGKFIIQTYHNSAGNCYIRQARLNGKPLHDFRFFPMPTLVKEDYWNYGWGLNRQKNGEFSPKNAVLDQ